jgi:glycosyltransferase involved in cell wall biosynthesis
MKPEVSIIVPVYNAEKYIGETISSVLAQTFSNWELILVNDGSTDESEKTIQSFLKDERIKYISKKNTGVADTRNAGIELAIGNYIALLDADDIWLPQNLEKKIELLATHKDVDWVYSNMQRKFEETGVIKISESGKEGNIIELLLAWEGEVIPGICSNIVLRKNCLEDGLRFDKNLSTAADHDFILNLCRKHKGKLLKEVLFTYRVLSTSMSKNAKRLEEDHLTVYRKAEKNNLFASGKIKRKSFANMYLILAGNWWKNGGNKSRSLLFVLRALFTYPPIIGKLSRKKPFRKK